MARKRKTPPGRIVRRRADRVRASSPTSTPTQMFDGRARYPAQHALKKFMRAYGNGEEADRLRASFAERCGTSVQYLIQLGLGYRRARAETAIAIEKATHGQVRCEDLNPIVDWAYMHARKGANLFAQAA